ncbi:Angiotensin-converting enzyme [Chionoecetes opilio]|uniref:Angiotensin-converting enzyme n=1 Tax=Chionoecetes opilio TaxID=41210 RepID=A0A8J5CHE3_CHIOP|nr:Angiotensin-converting enzyme [Chionoecetes opilio]
MTLTLVQSITFQPTCPTSGEQPGTPAVPGEDQGVRVKVSLQAGLSGYFVSFVVQFQFHKALCMKAGEYDPLNASMPLHKCDIYQSTEAGNALGDMLQMGSSKEWPDAMEALTGGREMDASVIREYFKPLEMWLKENNEKHGEFIGWESDETYCSSEGMSEKATGEPTSAASCCSPVPLLLLLVALFSLRH